MKRIAINGLGRIGRMVLRHYMDIRPKDVELMAPNDLVPTDNLAYLIKYDSFHGQAAFPIESNGHSLKMVEGGSPYRNYTFRNLS